MRNISQRRRTRALALAAGFATSLGMTAVALSEGLQLAPSQPAISSEAATPEMATKDFQESSGPGVFIVRLGGPSVAAYRGGIEGYAATNPQASGLGLNANLDAVSAYAGYLQQRQAAFIEQLEQMTSRTLDVQFTYQHAFNGIAVTLRPDEAEALATMDGLNVLNVEREKHHLPATDAGPQWIGAPSIWGHGHHNRGHGKHKNNTRGEGVVIGVLDTGINSDHPSFAAVGGDGFVHTNPLGSGNFVPNSYCDTVDPSFCNDKLIGAWTFVQGSSDPMSPEDDNGHGSHTSSTAAGNHLFGATLGAPTTTLSRDISGVAPHANLIMYDVCIVTCPGAALLAAVNQVVIDSAALPNGIAAINYSISGGNDPYNDSVELSFLNAVDAGVFVSASAGNSGPGPATTGHNSPWVATVAAMTHNRIIVNHLVDMTSDGDSLADIQGLGLTSGFGPAPIINSADLEGAFPGSTLCGLGVIGDFNPPWPAGTFNGEIVACTRGTFGRVEKGANVLAAGAGGYILMDNGAGEVGDAHVLPGVHISLAERAILEAWLAANTTTTGSISGFEVNLDSINGDIMAGFSSRGPNSSIDVIKPDIGGPGVSIFAAEANGQASLAPEYQFLSGTSMSSPHNAGSGALLADLHPDWTPSEIKSALMLTATTKRTLKEDGMTPTDHFDVGAGRINLRDARRPGLVMDETAANYAAADPALGGDPRTLNTPSMQDGTCIGECSWTRTVSNDGRHRGRWDLSWSGDPLLGTKISPRHLSLDGGASGDIDVSVNTELLSEGWHFANLRLHNQHGNSAHKLHMPIAVFAAKSTDPTLFTKTVDLDTASRGDILNYEINITNGQLAGQIDLTDVVPDGSRFVAGSESETITNGFTISPFSHNFSTNTLTWSGELDPGGLQLTESPAPLGFFSIAAFVPPFGCPSNCDDGGFIVNVPSFVYNGETHSQVILSVNGTLEAGSSSLLAASASNQNLPAPNLPNNLMAPFWTDLDMGSDGDGAEWFVGVFNVGLPDTVTIYEWNNIPLFGDPTTRFSFQIWVQNGTSGNIWFTYGQIDNVSTPSGVTVGVENSDGTVGSSYFFEGAGTPPIVGTDLMVEQLIGGTATFGFQAKAKCRRTDRIVNKATIATADVSHTAIAATACEKSRKHGKGH